MNRELIWSTLFQLLADLAPFVETGRKLIHWNDCSNMPALYLNQAGESVVKTGRGLPCTYTMSAEIYLYVRNESNGTPASQINDLLDKVDALFQPNPATDGRQTLNGLVFDAWLEGEIARDEGALGEIGVAIVPIKVMAHF